MFYEPFTKLKEVEPFFGHSIYKDGIEMTVIGANCDKKSEALYIQAVYEDGTEVSLTAMNWFYSAKYKGHQFGKEIKGGEKI